jgi:hypothetical protein
LYFKKIFEYFEKQDKVRHMDDMLREVMRLGINREEAIRLLVAHLNAHQTVLSDFYDRKTSIDTVVDRWVDSQKERLSTEGGAACVVMQAGKEPAAVLISFLNQNGSLGAKVKLAAERQESVLLDNVSSLSSKTMDPDGRFVAVAYQNQHKKWNVRVRATNLKASDLFSDDLSQLYSSMNVKNIHSLVLEGDVLSVHYLGTDYKVALYQVNLKDYFSRPARLKRFLNRNLTLENLALPLLVLVSLVGIVELYYQLRYGGSGQVAGMVVQESVSPVSSIILSGVLIAGAYFIASGIGSKAFGNSFKKFRHRRGPGRIGKIEERERRIRELRREKQDRRKNGSSEIPMRRVLFSIEKPKQGQFFPGVEIVGEVNLDYPVLLDMDAILAPGRPSFEQINFVQEQLPQASRVARLVLFSRTRSVKEIQETLEALAQETGTNLAPVWSRVTIISVVGISDPQEQLRQVVRRAIGKAKARSFGALVASPVDLELITQELGGYASLLNQEAIGDLVAAALAQNRPEVTFSLIHTQVADLVNAIENQQPNLNLTGSVNALVNYNMSKLEESGLLEKLQQFSAKKGRLFDEAA